MDHKSDEVKRAILDIGKIVETQWYDLLTGANEPEKYNDYLFLDIIVIHGKYNPAWRQ